MITIVQNQMQVQIHEMGAQLTSILYKGKEYLWQGDPKYWEGQAPLLFPAIGNYKDNEIKIEGVTRTMDNHGFLRTLEFAVVEHTENKVVMSAVQNEKTLEQYPYEFEVVVVFEIIDSKLHTSYTVKNINDKEMLYSFGLHPAFNCNVNTERAFEKYYVEFPEDTKTDTLLFNEDIRVMLDQTKHISLEEQKMFLKHEMFERTIIFKEITFNEVRLGNTEEGDYLKFTFDGFDIFAMWQPENAPFVCLEPWNGFDGIVQDFNDLEMSPTVQRLSARTEKCYTMDLEIL